MADSLIKFYNFVLLSLFFALFGTVVVHSDEYIIGQSNSATEYKITEVTSPRYLLYEVNYGEGFNLRRDVYLRMANLVKLLNDEEPWVLVLPPWGRVYHWFNRQLEQNSVPWSHFFHLESLQYHIPVIEFTEYLNIHGANVEEVLYLQKYSEGWTGGKWEEKMDIRDCIQTQGWHKDVRSGKWQWWFWGHDEVNVEKFQCLSVQAEYSTLKKYILENSKASSLMLARAEEVIHGKYSEWSPEWWTARRSMVFSRKLREIADEFRLNELNSTDEADGTVYDEDWTKMQKSYGSATGGPYISVHLRRQDFLHARATEVPSLKNAAKQITKAAETHKLDTIFIASDCSKKDFDKLSKYLSNFIVVRFTADEDLEELLDGGVAVVDQIIAAHARYFIGSSSSTFSFRIQEERELLGFEPKMTTNRLCGDKEKDCRQPTHWPAKYTSKAKRRDEL